MTAIDRTAYPRPGARLNREELDFRYDLTEVDLTFVHANARGDVGRLLLAVLLKTRQDRGCFPVPSEVHAGIIAHVAARLGLAAPHPLIAEVRWSSKLYRYHAAVRTHLGVTPYGETAERLLSSTVLDAAETMSDPVDLINRAIEALIFPWFRGHPQARFELEVFDGSASNRNEATFLHEDYKRQVVDLVASSGRTATAVAVEVGLHPTLLCRWVRQYGATRGQAEAVRVPAPSSKLLPVPTADQAAEIARLRQECDRLRMERDILKKVHFDLRGPAEMRFRVVEDCRGTWPVHELCRVLGLSTAGYYAWRSRPESKRTAEDRALLDDIRRAHEDSGGRYGSPRVHAALRAHGRQVGRGRVERLMRRHGVRGLVARRRQVQTTDSRHPFPIAPNLLDRQFAATTKPNQVWLADLTYIATGEGWLYVAAIMDLHTRKIVGWSMRDHLRAELATSALMMATQRQRPGAGLVHHSDRGIQGGLKWSSQHPDAGDCDD